MILEAKKIKEIESKVKQYLDDGTIKTKAKKEFVDFFLQNSLNSLNSAHCLYDISENKELQAKVGYSDFNGYLWVINASYYSMFYNARALLENEGIKISSDQSIHSKTFDAIVYFFYITGKLEKQLLEYYLHAHSDATSLLGQKIADELILDYSLEKGKRSDFTYQTGLIAMQSKAKTSLDRAIKFNKEVRRILKKI